MINRENLYVAGAFTVLLAPASCNDQTNPGVGQTDVMPKAQSTNLSLVKEPDGFSNLGIMPLISSNHKLEQSPDFVYGGQPDGAGLMKNPTGDGYVFITSHEFMRSVTLDKTFKPVKGEYVVDYEGGTWRLCSATPDEHGFGPVFLTAG